MASAFDSDVESMSDSESDAGSDVSTSSSDSDYSSGVTSSSQDPAKDACKYYNASGGCKNGAKCKYQHICKYFLRGKCRYGNQCRLSHARKRASSADESFRPSIRSNITAPALTDGRAYQWQLDNGKGWKDIRNDHIIEAQYSLPHTKSIKIYNTKYGAVSIDFQRMKVYGKDLKVRRLDDGHTTWLWFCVLGRKWIKYGGKSAQGGSSPLSCAQIEKVFRNDPRGVLTFNMGARTVHIQFADMQQVSQKKKRKVTRRPLFRHKQGIAAVPHLITGVQNLSVGSKPQWQFEGDSGGWHNFKRRSGTSTDSTITSDDIEKKYQQNPRGSLNFKVNTQPYILDFTAMKQTNLQTKRERKIRRM